jgi:hypothetical protein
VRHDAAPGSGIDGPVVRSLQTLLTSFEKANITYCYWKSSRRVHAVLAGEADLDLLIARSDQHRAHQVLLECGFKLFPCVAHRDHPAISSFLGYDEPTGRIVHVHAYFRLVIGESLLKNYRLPWEDAILSWAIPHPTLPFRILDPVSEALLLMVRACLELRPLDPVTLRHWRATKDRFARDRAELAERVDRGLFRSRAGDLMDEDLADRLADAMYDGGALEVQGGLRRRVRKEFAAFRTYNAVEGRLRSVGRAVLWITGGLNKQWVHAPRPWGRRAPGGGIVVAVIGVDGSGKSTLTAEIRAWLGSEIDVLPTYFGTGDGRPSLLLLPLKLMVPLITPLLGTKPKGASHGSVSSRPPGVLYSMLLVLWATVLTVEKRLKLLAARRAAGRGMVVVADRYAQNEILDFNDGPLMPRVKGAPRWLRRFEERPYALASRLPPELVIRLQATPEALAAREPDMDVAVIRDRLAALRRLTFPGARVVDVDAEQPLAEVIRATKCEIWRLL